MAGDCGSCSECCTLMGIHDLPTYKPRGKVCQFKALRGCKIYAERPPSCKTFVCIWLDSQSIETPMPRRLRPDISKVMIIPLPDDAGIEMIMRPGQKDAWYKNEGMRNIAMSTIANGKRVAISYGDERFLLTWDSKLVKLLPHGEPDQYGNYNDWITEEDVD